MWQSNSAAGRCAAAALVLVLCVWASARADGIAVVIKVKGSVSYQVEGSDAWEPVKAGLVLPDGCRIRTDDDGLAMVKFLSDGSMMRLKPQTSLTLASRDSDKGGATLSMGAALFDVKKTRGRDRFTVTTQTTVATVKGTRFWVTVRADTATVLACLEGKVGVKCIASGDEKDVRGGFTAVVDEDLVVRATQSSDLPADEQTQRFEFRFEGKDGSTRTLGIESTPAK